MQKKIRRITSLEKNKKVMTSTSTIPKKTKVKTKSPEKKKDPVKRQENKEVKK